jgi:hypothetical protein
VPADICRAANSKRAERQKAPAREMQYVDFAHHVNRVSGKKPKTITIQESKASLDHCRRKKNAL